jgi:acyl transferase domain-containing protein
MSSNAVAIVGMACRFPGASDPETLWRNLSGGVESIRRFSREELLAEGLSPALADHPRFVSAHGSLDDIKGFDAAFFGYSPGDAALTDPQQRLFLECAYEAFEHAGIVPREGGPVTGVFAGCGVNVYFLQNVFASLDQDDVGAVYQAVIGSEKDFLTARVNYKLGLTGPSVTIQAACATSLVAVHVASAISRLPAARRFACRRPAGICSARAACTRPMAGAAPSTPTPVALSAAAAPARCC